MRTTNAVFCIAAFAALSEAQLIANVIPPIGLAPGSPYQLIFVTADNHDATSSDIADYNAFVRYEASLSPSLPATTWQAVASTATVNANVNAPSISGLPVYNTNGIEVASGATGLYSINNVLSPIGYNQYGDPAFDTEHPGATLLWTGANTSGGPGNANNAAIGTGFTLGTTTIQDGWGVLVAELGVFQPSSPTASFQNWIDVGAVGNLTERLPLYALSGALISPVPEPSTLVLAASGLIALVAWGSRRRRVISLGARHTI